MTDATRARIRTAAIALAVVAVLLAPVVAWRLQKTRHLEVVILDKTVPFEVYREHAAIPWILHAMKIQDARGRFLDPATDYVGFDPKKKVGTDLDPSLLAHADVLFIADTYGVYRGDYERGKNEAALERSPKIYGGLTDRELDGVDALLARDGVVIGEFNAFASPTEEQARHHAEQIFGAKWTHWVGRYWADLRDPNEVPKWVGQIWERVNHTPFSFEGGGFVLVKEDEDIVVLRDKIDLGAAVVTQQRTPAGGVFDFPERGAFRYWMDVLEPTGGNVLYEHVIDTTAAGDEKLKAHGLSRRFPALLHQKNAWYFAGDFVDNTFDLGWPELAWTLDWHERTSGCGPSSSSDEAFFWTFYVPIVSRILASKAH